MVGSAVISECGRYRYLLERDVRGGPVVPVGERLVFAMCNPSTANAELDDATIRKCRGFGAIHGFERIAVINICAYRSRHPKQLLAVEDPIGPENFKYVRETARCHQSQIVVAWGGCLPKKIRPLIPGFLAMLAASPRPIKCFGVTSTGMPRHPLMLSYSTPMEPYHP